MLIGILCDFIEKDESPGSKKNSKLADQNNEIFSLDNYLWK